MAQELETLGDGVEGLVVDGESRTDGLKVTNGEPNDSTSTGPAKEQEAAQSNEVDTAEATEWVIVARMDGAHGVFEVNHVAWAPRRDSKDAAEQDELIVTTGDDGTVKVWSLDL